MTVVSTQKFVIKIDNINSKLVNARSIHATDHVADVYDAQPQRITPVRHSRDA